MTEENTLVSTSGNPLGEISQAPPALEVFLDKHQSKLIVLALILIVAAVGYVVFKGLKESAEVSAGNLLMSSDDISDLQSIVKNHQDTSAAFSAKVLLAEKQWEDGQQDDSIGTLRAFIDGEKGHPGSQSAKASLAAKLRIQGKADEAKQLFSELTEDPNARFIAPYAWIAIGDMESENGNSDAAATAYEAVERDFPESSYVQEAMSRRQLLKAVAPKEIVAPISVPDVNFTNGEDGAVEPNDGVQIQDLIKGGNESPDQAPAVPEIEDENSPKTSD